MASVIAHSKDCPGGSCPTTYAHPERGMSYVQGYRVSDPMVLAEFDIPEGEELIAVPDSLLADHVRAVRA